MAGMSITTKYTEKALQVDGVDVDQYQTSITFAPEMVQSNKMLGMLQMLGLTSQTGYTCASGNYVITITSSDQTLIKRALASVKEQAGLGSAAGLAQVRTEGLPEDPAAQFYLNANGLVSIVNMIVPMLGGPAIKLPADLPPIAAGFGLGDGGMAERVYVPLAVITAVKDAIEQVQQQMMQRGAPAPRQGGGPGGPPAPPF
jgi:hypothetical protein